MFRKATVFVSLLLVACATARTNDLIAGDTLGARASTPESGSVAPEVITELAVDPSVFADSSTGSGSAALSEPSLALTTAVAPLQEDGLHGNRFTLKGGYFGSTEDALDDGYIFGVSWMNFMSKLFAVELEIGYLDVDGDDAGVKTDVWAVPIMLNGRFNLPIWVLEGYAGVGIGTFYYDAEASGAVSADEDGFLWGGNAFLGASFNLADALALGLELKYYMTDDISDDIDASLDAYAVMLTLGWRR